LDTKNGFRHFKLGTSPSQIKNIVRTESKINNEFNTTSYKYVGTDIQTLVGVNVDEIKLSFFNDKLFSISVSFGDYGEDETGIRHFTEDEYAKIKVFLEQIYGTEWKSATKHKNMLDGTIWDGTNVRLELNRNRFDHNTEDTEPRDYLISGYICIFDKKLMKEVFKNQF
jgi:hypothetical protein